MRMASCSTRFIPNPAVSPPAATKRTSEMIRNDAFSPQEPAADSTFLISCSTSSKPSREESASVAGGSGAPAPSGVIGITLLEEPMHVLRPLFVCRAADSTLRAYAKRAGLPSSVATADKPYGPSASPRTRPPRSSTGFPQES